MQVRAVVSGILALVVIAVVAQDPSYDHQTKTYVPQFKPVTKNNAFISIMPFFSPDHSIDSAVEMIQNATQTLDISTPGFSSWIGCTYFEEGCVGCPLDRQLNETFPVFPALLNAAHRGVRIRLMTNDYKTPTCKGKIAPMDWLYANGVDIRYYTSTTFTHSKYMSTDGTQTSISSVNFSQASFMKNREAGVVLGDGCDDMIAMAKAVFEFDWAQAYAYTFDPSQYTQAELDMIRSPLPYSVVMPPQPNIPGAFVTPQPTWITGNVQLATIFTSPDFAHDTVMPLLTGATSSVDIMIYQITDDSLCQAVIALYHRGVNVRLLVSDTIYDETDWKAAQACYGQIYTAGLRFRKTPKYYNYSHQKFFIVDNSTVSVSTGNFSPSDYPQNPPFPPYGQSGWQSVNRDYSLIFTDADTVAVFESVLSQDWQRGSDWTPSPAASTGSEAL